MIFLMFALNDIAGNSGQPCGVDLNVEANASDQDDDVDWEDG